jgi:hypothetical protein
LIETLLLKRFERRRNANPELDIGSFLIISANQMLNFNKNTAKAHQISGKDRSTTSTTYAKRFPALSVVGEIVEFN